MKTLALSLLLLAAPVDASPLIGAYMGTSKGPQTGTRDVRDVLPAYRTQLRAYYRFDGTYQDSSGNGLHSVIQGSASRAGGLYGQGLNLNGTTDYVKYSTNLLSTSTNLSVSMWVKTTSSTGLMSLFSSGVTTGCNPSRHGFFLYNGKLQANVGCGTWLTSSVDYGVGVWNHMVYVMASDKTITLYQNGVKVAGPTDISSGLALSSGAELIGACYNSNNIMYFLNGQVDDVALWEGVSLTEADVIRLYGATSTEQLLSQNQPASQSTTLSGVLASAANDGVLNNFSHTDYQANPWWQVDLGFRRPISRVAVYNRADRSCPSHPDCPRVSNFDIYVSDDAANWTAVGYNAGIAVYPTSVTVSTAGRYVRVQTRNTNYLDPAEIQVYGPSYALPSIANQVLWFDAAKTGSLYTTSTKTTKVAANGDPIGAWSDQISGLDVLQATSGQRPTLISGALNGRPVARFPGCNACTLVSTGTANITAANTIMAVVKDNGTNEFGGILSHSGAIGLINSSGRYTIDGWGGIGAQSTSDTQKFRIVTGIYNQASTNNSLMYVDGFLDQNSQSGGVGTNPGSNVIEIGGRTFGGYTTRVLKGDIAEILVYNRVLTDKERAQLETYLNAKWGLEPSVSTASRVPQWAYMPSTTSYSAAFQICAGFGRRLCYRSEYCPNGNAGGEVPYGGAKKSGDRWAPVKDQVNNWVQVGDTNWPSCQLHTEIGGGVNGLPSWSTDGTNSYGFKQYILCCY